MKLTKNSKRDVSPLWLLLVSIALFITQFFVGNAGLTALAGIMDILAIILFIAAIADLVRSKLGTGKSREAITRKQRSKLRKQRYAALSEKPVWRLVQVAYGLLIIVWASILATRDSYNYTDDGDRWGTVGLALVVGGILYLLLRKLAAYIAFGKPQNSNKANMS